MLKYVLCSLFVLHSTFSYGLEDTFDKPLQHTSQQEFFSNQNNCLQKAVKEHSIVYEVRQQLLIKGIQMLQLPKLNIQVGGINYQKVIWKSSFKINLQNLHMKL